MSLLLASASAWAAPPLFDVHTHYKWDQAEITSPAQALQFMDEAGVEKAVVIGTPARLALKLRALAPDRILAFYGPYLVGGEKLAWQSRDALIDEARAGLESGRYQGIGELHLIGGMSIRWERSRVLRELLGLAKAFDVPVMIHTEYSDSEPTLRLCRTHPDIRILLAHAGAVLPPAAVREVLGQCPNVSMDLAARDPWRFLANPITGADGRLLPGWHDLVMAFPGRFMVGSDPVWPVDKGFSWDEADSGWQEMGRFIAFHREWLSHLPADVANRIRWTNALEFFRLQPPED